MKRARLFCEKCKARRSKVEEIHGKPVAVCKACGANIPLYKDEYGKYHPKRVESRVIVP